MEDNIGDMMVEIRGVVSNHLSNVKKEFTDTLNVINTLPLVITLRKQIRKLENENKQLKMLVDSIGEEKNIELEIVEVPKKNIASEEEDGEDIQIDELEDDSDNDSDVSSTDFDSNLCADFADEEELGIVVDKMVNTNKDKDTPEELTINQNDDIPRDI